MGIMRLLRKPLRCEAGPASLTPSSLSLDALAIELTLEGADEVAPEPGLLGEGGVVGVEVEVHLAHAGVAAAHPETQAEERQCRLSQSDRHLPLPFLHASKKHTGRSKKGELQQTTATYLEIQHRASLHCLLNKQHVHCPWHHGEMSIELVIMSRLCPTIWTHPVTAYSDGDVRLRAYLNSGDGIGKFRPRRPRAGEGII